MAEVGTYYITIMPEMSQFTGTVNKALKGAGAEGGKTYGTSFIDIVKGSALGSALGSLAGKAGGAIASGFSTGISRLDTIKNYPKVMESLGYSTDEADKSIKTIVEHLDGLPTATQDMVTLTQSISDSTGDLDLATAAALGFNDMMLANGASAEEMATAQGVLNRVLGKGSATTAQWQSLTSVMPAQLNMVAKSMLGASASSEDLHEALEDGTISWNDFLQAIADLDKNGYIDESGKKLASFEEQARANSHGIGTAIDNIKNRIGAGWAQILDKVGQEEISGAIDKMSYGVKDAMFRVADAVGYVKDAVGKTKIAENFGKLADKVSDAFKRVWNSGGPEILKSIADALVDLTDRALQWMVDNGDLVASAIVGIAMGLATLAAFEFGASLAAIPGILAGIADAVNPVALVTAGIAALVVGLMTFFTQTETGKAICEAVCTALSDLWTGLQRDFETLVQIWNDGIEVSKAQWELFQAKIQGVADAVGGFFGNLGREWDETVAGIKQNIEDNAVQWQQFKTNLATWNEDMRQNIAQKWDEIKQFVKDNVHKTIDDTKSQWSTWVTNTQQWNENIRQSCADKWRDIKQSVKDSVRQTIEDTRNQWSTWRSNMAQWNEEIRQAALDKWREIGSGIYDKMSWAFDQVRSIIDRIKGLFNFSWSLPAPKLPRINWHWNDIGGLLSIPVFDGISWYAKGGVFDTATLIGIGEKGKEAALPLNDKTYGEIARGITDELGTAGVTVTGNTFVIREEADIERIADALSRKIRRERMAMV